MRKIKENCKAFKVVKARFKLPLLYFNGIVLTIISSLRKQFCWCCYFKSIQSNIKINSTNIFSLQKAVLKLYKALKQTTRGGIVSIVQEISVPFSFISKSLKLNFNQTSMPRISMFFNGTRRFHLSLVIRFDNLVKLFLKITFRKLKDTCLIPHSSDNRCVPISSESRHRLESKCASWSNKSNDVFLEVLVGSKSWWTTSWTNWVAKTDKKMTWHECQRSTPFQCKFCWPSA